MTGDRTAQPIVFVAGLWALLVAACSEPREAATETPPPSSPRPADASRAQPDELERLFADLVARDSGRCGVGSAWARDVRERARDALVLRGAAVVPALSARLTAADDFERLQLLHVLARLGPTGHDVVVDEALAGREDALATFAVLDPVPPRAVQHAMSALDAGAFEPWLAGALGRISADETQPLDTRVRAIDGLLAEARSRPFITHEVVSALRPVPTREDAALAVLAAVLRDPRRLGWSSVLIALQRFEGRGAASIAAIFVRESYEIPRVLRLLLRLGEDAEPARAAVRPLVGAANDEDALLAIRVLSAMEPREDRRSTRRLLRMLRPGARPNCSREDAARAIGAVAAPSDLPRLEELASFYDRAAVGDALRDAMRQIRARHEPPPP